MIYNVIIKHIFKYFTAFMISSDKLRINKKLSIELDDGTHIQKYIWGATGKISNSIIKILIADITTDESNTEYVLLLQMDKLSIYALKIDLSDDKNISKAYINHNNEIWIELSTLLLAKLLVGIEQLNELFIDYKPIDDYQELYQHFISFMNYAETIQSLK